MGIIFFIGECIGGIILHYDNLDISLKEIVHGYINKKDNDRNGK